MSGKHGSYWLSRALLGSLSQAMRGSTVSPKCAGTHKRQHRVGAAFLRVWGLASGVGLDGCCQDVQAVDEELVGDDQRRQQTDDVAVGAAGEDDDAFLQAGSGNSLGQFRVRFL